MLAVNKNHTIKIAIDRVKIPEKYISIIFVSKNLHLT